MSDDTLPVTRTFDDAPATRAAAPADHSPATQPSSPPPPDDPAPGTKGDKPGRRKKPRGFVRRHKILISLAVVLALVAGGAGYAWYWLNHQLSGIERVDAGIDPDPPQKPGVEKTTDLNVLLLGADNGHDSESVADDMADGEWTPGLHRSDTLMIAHIPADRDSVQIVSIPRDTWVDIDGYGPAKINAAFSEGGPALAIDTVEELTGIHIDHLAVIDWNGFKDLTEAIGGVRVYIPETFYDDSQHITWEQGWHELEGREALQYVRTRHGLANGDFDRINRQQNFMRATMGEVLSSTRNVGAMIGIIKTVTKFLTIDDTWSNQDIISLGLSLRDIRSDDVEFMQAPFGSYGTSSDGQSYVNLDKKKSRQLFRAIKKDDLQSYLDKYPGELLDGTRQVN